MFRAITVICIALLACGCAQRAATSTDGRATVTRVIDGDTIVVHIGGRDENVRILGIDTSKPQKTPLPRQSSQPFRRLAKRASASPLSSLGADSPLTDATVPVRP